MTCTPHEARVNAHNELARGDLEAELPVEVDVPVNVGFQEGGQALLIDHAQERSE